MLENNGAAPFAEQLEWVKADLAQNVKKGKHLVVLTHQPMNVPFGSPSVYDEYGKVLEQYGAELILVGHEHSNDVEPKSDFAGTAKHIQTIVELVHDRQLAARVPVREHEQQDLRQPVPDVRRGEGPHHRQPGTWHRRYRWTSSPASR